MICASTGNTSASAAAYAARAGLTVRGRASPQGQIALGKLAQALIHGARSCRSAATSTRRSTIVRELGERPGVEVVNSVNPVRIEGQKTAAFEIVDALGDAPDVHCIPVGNAGNITAYWRGYGEYDDARHATRRAAHARAGRRTGAAPIVRGEPVLHPETIATAIRIGNPASLGRRGRGARRVGRRTSARSPTPRSSTAYRLLAAEEGVFVEPASAASVAGLLQAAADGLVDARRRGRVHGHRPRAEGPAARDRARSRSGEPVDRPTAGAVRRAPSGLR